MSAAVAPRRYGTVAPDDNRRTALWLVGIVVVVSLLTSNMLWAKLGEIIGAIERLKTHYRPKRTVLVGHSGGAASAAIIIGMAPAIAEAALLVAIPGDLRTWRAGRRHWSRSENPSDWVGKVAPTTRVIALTGDLDTNTWPELAQQYTQLLQKNGVRAQMRLIERVDHNGAFRAPEITASLRELVADGAAP